MKTEKELFSQIGRCIRSAADNYKDRATPSNFNALGDIESDLADALKAVKELFKRRDW